MIQTIIIDDEAIARKTLINFLNRFFPDIKVIAQANSVKSGIQVLNDYNPDLVFLDIEMPHGTGFNILENIDNINFSVIFITAYDQYAIEAFKFSAIDYLLKPLNISELKIAVEKFKKRNTNKGQTQKIKVLIDNLNNEQNKIYKLVLPIINGFQVVEINDIIRCEGDRNYTKFIFTNDKMIHVSKTMKEFEELLIKHGFFRIHQSHLINLKYVEKYIKGYSGGGKVKMSDDSALAVSRNKKKDFLNRFY